MQDFWNSSNAWLSKLAGRDNMWMVEVFLIVSLTLLCAFVARVILKNLEKKALLTNTLWDDALVHALGRPLRWLIWLVGISYAASIAGEVAESEIFTVVDTVRHVGVVFIGAWFLNRFISRAETNVVNPGYLQKPMDKTTALALAKLLRISVIITALLIALQSLGYSISGVLAFGGIGGIAIGFAAKDLLANFFGGLMIYLDRPFAVGDWVRSPDKNIEGTVEDIGWRLTRIRTFDKRPLYVPNATFTQISVENPSRMLNRRIYEKISIRYQDGSKMRAIVAQVKQMIETHEAIDTHQIIMVNFNEFAASSLDFFVYCFTKTTVWAEYHEIKQDVLLKVLDIVEEHGAECAFPTSTIHVPDDITISGARLPETLK